MLIDSVRPNSRGLVDCGLYPGDSWQPFNKNWAFRWVTDRPEFSIVLTPPNLLAWIIVAGLTLTPAWADTQASLKIRPIVRNPSVRLFTTSNSIRNNSLSTDESAIKAVLVEEERYYGPTHIELCPQLLELARYYEKQGRLSEAEGLYKRVMSIQDLYRNYDRRVSGDGLSGLLGVYKKQGRTDEVKRLLQQRHVNKTTPALTGSSHAGETLRSEDTPLMLGPEGSVRWGAGIAQYLRSQARMQVK